MILTSGCFDGIHAGHVLFLQTVRRDLGMAARVIVAPDDYIRATKHREPYWPQVQRAFALDGLKCVEAAIVQPADTSLADIIRVYRPWYFVKGIEWRGALPDDVVEACRQVECSVVFINAPGKHTSEARG